MEINYNSVSSIREVLEKYGFAPRKKWGQNYLINPDAKNRLIKLLDPKPDETIWEVGPGLGAMTVLFARDVKKVVLFEIDPGYIALLGDVFADCEHLSIVKGDVIKTWKQTMDEQGAPDKVFGNLPYNSVSSMITSFFNSNFIPKKMIFTVQKEMAQRMAAKPGNKNYSSFSILCQSCGDTVLRGDLNPGSFYPRPDVVSSIIEIIPNNFMDDLKDISFFRTFVRDVFLSRRKTMKKNILNSPRLKEVGTDRIFSALEKLKIDPMVRAEVLSPQQFKEIANTVAEL